LVSPLGHAQALLQDSRVRRIGRESFELSTEQTLSHSSYAVIHSQESEIRSEHALDPSLGTGSLVTD
jgi:hypothetical protein